MWTSVGGGWGEWGSSYNEGQEPWWGRGWGMRRKGGQETGARLLFQNKANRARLPPPASPPPHYLALDGDDRK